MMGSQALLRGGRFDGAQLYGARSGLDGAVDEEDCLGLGDVFGEVGGPLLPGDYVDFRLRCEVLLGPFGQPGANAVVAAQGVATGEDENADLGWTHELSV